MGDGFVVVPDYEQYILPPPIEVDGEPVYSISVFHQLHCLVRHATVRPRVMMVGYRTLGLTAYLTLVTCQEAYNALACGTPAPDTASTTNDPLTRAGRRSEGHISNSNHHHDAGHRRLHIDHCFRYLRQALMCCGDTALEGHDSTKKDVPDADSTPAVHLCKDYALLVRWAEEHRGSDDKNL